MPWIAGDRRGMVIVRSPRASLPAATLQDALTAFEQKADVEVDYIHGEDETIRLGTQANTVGRALAR